MRKLIFKFLGSSLGSNLIEFAIIAPVFILMVLGALDLGAMMVIQNAVDTGARAASRFGLTGATGGTTRSAAIINEINTTVSAYSGGIINLNNLVINVQSYPDLTNYVANTGTVGSYGTGGQIVKYTISYQWNSFLALFGVPSPITLTGIAAVQNENF